MEGIGFAIILCLAAIGSLYWVMPSKRDKNLALLRSHAMQRSMRVRLLDVSLMQNCFKWLKDHRGWVLYELHTPLITSNADAFKPFSLRLSQHDSTHDGDFDLAYAQQLALDLIWPPNAEALLFHTGGVSLLWNERLDIPSELKDAEVAELMTRMKENLKQCAALAVRVRPGGEA